MKRYHILDIVNNPNNCVCCVYVYDTILESILVCEWFRIPTCADIKYELAKHEDASSEQFYPLAAFSQQYQTYASKIEKILSN